MEVQGNRQNNENPFVQHKCQVCIAIYGAETWRMNKTTLKMIHTFVNQCLRKILGIQWMDKVSNKDLWERTRQVQTEIDILMVSTVPHSAGESRIFIRCPASREMRQMSRIFRKWYYYFFVADYFTYLPSSATK